MPLVNARKPAAKGLAAGAEALEMAVLLWLLLIYHYWKAKNLKTWESGNRNDADRTTQTDQMIGDGLMNYPPASVTDSYMRKNVWEL